MENLIHEIRISTASLIMILEGLELLKYVDSNFSKEEIQNFILKIKKVIDEDEERSKKEGSNIINA